MKLIKPKSISGEIMTLIEEADEKLIIVSPYCKFSNWKKLLTSFDVARSKNIHVEFYVRKNEFESLKEAEIIVKKATVIENLHTKLYINEKYAIVSSMNLIEYSDTNSLDIAYRTETELEYKELYEYYERYLLKNYKIEETRKAIPVITKKTEPSKTDEFHTKIAKLLPKNKTWRILPLQSSYNIELGDVTYIAFIFHYKTKKCLRVIGSITEYEYNYAKKIGLGSTDKVYLALGGKNTSNNRSLTLTYNERLVTDNIKNILSSELEFIVENTLKFISKIEKLKADNLQYYFSPNITKDESLKTYNNRY